MKVACIQMRSGIDRAANVDAATDFIREAAGAGAELILTPEMTNVLDRQPVRLFRNLPDAEEPSEIETFANLASTLGVSLIVGSMAVGVETESERRKIANRCFAFSPSGGRATYDKLHLFDVTLPTGESWKESSTMVHGDEAVLVEFKAAKVGLSICYDVRFPHHFRTLAKQGAQILTVPAAFTRPTGQAHWHTLLRARAIETGSFVMAAAQGGVHEDGRETYGHSLIVDPWGTIVAEKADDVPGIIMADINLAKVAESRAQIPNLALDRDVETRTYTP